VSKDKLEEFLSNLAAEKKEVEDCLSLGNALGEKGDRDGAIEAYISCPYLS